MIFFEFLKAEEHRDFSESTMKRTWKAHDFMIILMIWDSSFKSGKWASIINTYILSLCQDIHNLCL